MILQVRVNPKYIWKFIPETLNAATNIDSNYTNSELEWLIKPDPNGSLGDRLVVYGVFLRVTDEHPSKLPDSHWWNQGQN